MEKELKIPKISEDADEADVAEILVSEGDTIEKDQAILTVESDKANVEIPSDFAGKVTKIKVSKGDTVTVGDVVMTVEVGEAESDSEEDDSAKTESDKDAAKEDDSKEEVSAATESKDDDDQDDSDEKETSEKDKKESESADKAKKEAPKEDKSDEKDSNSQDDRETEEDESAEDADQEIPVAPLARKFARELGVSISDVPRSGERLTREDVANYVKELIAKKKEASSEGFSAPSLPDFSRWGETERKPLSGIRKATAKNTLQSWRHIPHVTQNDKANVSGLEAFLEKQNEKSDEKITLTAILLKVSAEALDEFPNFNASIDLQEKEMVYKKYFHIGVAVDTDDGLLLPVIKDVKEKSIAALAKELSDAAEKAREGKLTADEMKGGNFTISNLGGIGGTGFTPVIFPPQVAILGVSRTQTEAVFKDGEFSPQSMLPLSLSYDHRAVDGAGAARFLRWICESLEQPMNLMMH